MAAPMIAEDTSLIGCIGVIEHETQSELTWRPRLRTIWLWENSEPSKGGRHAHITVYPTFPRQNHGRLERLRSPRDPRHIAPHRVGGGPEGSALAQTDS